LPSNPTIPVKNCETPFYDVDNYWNTISPQAYHQAPQTYQQTPQAYQPQYQESFYGQPQSYAQEGNESYYYWDYGYGPEQSSAQYGTQDYQTQSQSQEEYYYTQDCYMMPENYYQAVQSDHQVNYLATQADVNSYATSYQTYPAQNGQPPKSQGEFPQGYVTPSQPGCYPVKGQYLSY
jgi:hypothetical protein